MRILALDLGRFVGVCVGASGARPDVQTWELPRDVGGMMSVFEGKLRGIIRREQPQLIAYEKPFMAFGSKARANSVKHLYTAFGQAAHVLKLCHETGAIPQAISVRSARKQVCGSAKVTPEDIIKSCVRAGMSPEDDHSADACIIWRCAVQKALTAKEAA